MKSKQKQSKAPVSKCPDTDPPMCFVQALSLQTANSNANCARLKGATGYLGSSTDSHSIFSSSNNDAHTCMRPPTHISTGAYPYQPTHICLHAASTHTSVSTRLCSSKHISTDTCSSFSSTQIYMNSTTHTSTNTCICSYTHAATNTSKGSSTHTCIHTCTDAVAVTSKLCSYGSTELFNSAEASVNAIGCKDFECDFHTMSSCGIKAGPHLCNGKIRMVPCAQNDRYGAIDNDTEGSNVLTPNTNESSFGRESSSAESSMVHKCGYTEENRQCMMLWQEEDESSGLGNLESSMEASVYLNEEAPQFSKWQGKSSSEDSCSFDMEATSRLSYSEGTLQCACSLDMEAMSRLTYNAGHQNWHERRSQNMAENHSVSSFYKCHTSAFHASRIGPGCAFSMWYEGSPSFENPSFGPMPMQKEERKSCSPKNVSSAQRSNLTAAKNCSQAGCKVSVAEDLKVIPSLWKERSIFEGSMLCSLSYSEWEERSALIAVDNPGLMLSSKWQESACTTLQNSSLESTEKVDQNSDLLTCAGQDDRNGKSMCVSQDNSNGLSMCVQQDNRNGLSVCFRQDNGNAGFHKSIHDAYLRRGRRHRGSSFSAALPKDLQGVVGDSIALVKMSHNPYEDFRHSMYEMIMEKDLEESMDVEELLYCYLSLNSPEHHELIEEVFSDVWSSILMSVR